MPRLLVLIGSGETSRMAAAIYREVRGRFSSPPATRLLDTTYAFQENRGELSGRLSARLGEYIGEQVEVAGAGAADETVRRAAAQADLEDADLVVAGPGSPSYALRHWMGTSIPDVLAAKLEDGGALVLASAAACTAGAWALPVYEIYKAGHDPHWLPGLDLTRLAGLDVAVIPHFNNAEGGNHDTRYCYMGERRLRRLEAQLPASTAVLGVDEHTAAILDLDADTVTVRGRGTLTVRHHGAVAQVLTDVTAPLDALRRADGAAEAGTVRSREPSAAWAPGTAPADGPASLTAAVGAALDRDDAEACVAALLELDQRSRDSAVASERDAARAALHAGIARLGRAAAACWDDQRNTIPALVEAVLSVREEARRRSQFSRADALRKQLHAVGVDVRDTPDGPVWSPRSHDEHGPATSTLPSTGLNSALEGKFDGSRP